MLAAWYSTSEWKEKLNEGRTADVSGVVTRASAKQLDWSVLVSSL